MQNFLVGRGGVLIQGFADMPFAAKYEIVECVAHDREAAIKCISKPVDAVILRDHDEFRRTGLIQHGATVDWLDPLMTEGSWKLWDNCEGVLRVGLPPHSATVQILVIYSWADRHLPCEPTEISPSRTVGVL